MRSYDKKKNILKANLLAEQRHTNDNSLVREIFGFSKKEKAAKELIAQYGAAKEEAEKYNVARLISQVSGPGNKQTPEEKQEYRIKAARYKEVSVKDELKNVVRFMNLNTEPTPITLWVQDEKNPNNHNEYITLKGLEFMKGEKSVWEDEDAKAQLLNKLMDIAVNRLGELGVEDKTKALNMLGHSSPKAI